MDHFDWNHCIQDKNKLLVLLAGHFDTADRKYAAEEDLQPIHSVLTMQSDHQWVPAIAPVPRNVGYTFGRLLAEDDPGRTVGLLPCAVGGTSIAAWLPDGAEDRDNSPYGNAVKRGREAQRSGKIVAVLWLQGESCLTEPTPDYAGKLKTVIRNLRRDLSLNSEVPFIIGDMASFYQKPLADRIGLVDDAIDAIAAEDPAVRCVRTKDLTPREDGLHYDNSSLHEMGKRYYREYIQFRSNPQIRIFADCEGVICEGPFFSHPDGMVYWVNPGSLSHEGMPGCILRKSGGPINDFEPFDPGVGTVSAFSQRQDGTFLLFADKCRVWLWKPGEKAELFSILDESKFKFNDVTTTPEGYVFCTVLPEDLGKGTGELWRLAPDGSFTLLDTCRGIPNGMGFSPDGKTAYFTASSEKTIYCYDHCNGKLSRKRVFVSDINCDGLAVDTEGCVWSAGWAEKIFRFDPTGKLVNEWRLPGVIISSLCFGGKEMRDIYITTANYPYDRSNCFKSHAGNVLIWENSPFCGQRIPFFKDQPHKGSCIP